MPISNFNKRPANHNSDKGKPRMCQDTNTYTLSAYVVCHTIKSSGFYMENEIGKRSHYNILYLYRS